MITLKSFVCNLENIKKIHAIRSQLKVNNSSLSICPPLDVFIKNFSKKFNSINQLPPQAIYNDKQFIGLVYYSLWHHQNSCEISIFIDQKHLSNGYGTKALKLALEDLSVQKYERIVAFVKPNNLVAQKCFDQLGFSSCGLVSLPKHQAEFELLKFEYLTKHFSKPNTYIIAEAGSNVHMGNFSQDLKMAKLLTEKAAFAKASAIKFQLYTSKGVYVPNANSADYLDQDINKIFDEYALDPKLIAPIASYCNLLGIDFMCSFFSEEDFHTIDPFVKAHKIASYEIRHLRLLELAAKSKKPLYLSTGAACLEDIEWATKTFKKYGGSDLILLHCTAQYPADELAANLKCIKSLKETFNLNVGLSDHTKNPTIAPTIALALGASVIEKHFTLHQDLPGPDHSFAITTKELKDLCETIISAEKMLGVAKKEIFPQEEELAQFGRRGLQAISPIFKGDLFIEGENVAILRPGQQPLGMHPKYIDQINDRSSLKEFKIGQGIQYEDVSW